MMKNIIALIIIGTITVISSYFMVSDSVENIGSSISITELSDTIGTFRTNVNSSLRELNADLSYSTSTDPGHKHTTDAISGQIGVAQGGTDASTFTEGLLYASGTEAFITLSPSSDGQIPIASGTGWTANTLTASGTNITVYNTPGRIFLESSEIDFSSDNTFTGQQTFAGGLISTASTTLQSTTTVSGVLTISSSADFSNNIPTIPTSTPTNSNEVTSKKYVDDEEFGWNFATTTDVSIEGTSNWQTVITTTVPANTLTQNGAIRGIVYISQWQVDEAAYSGDIRIGYGGNNATLSAVDLTDVDYNGFLEFYLIGNASTTSQTLISTLNLQTKAEYQPGANETKRVTISTDSTTNQTLSVEFLGETDSNTLSADLTVCGAFFNEVSRE